MAATDTFSRFQKQVDGPASFAAAVTPDDNTDLATATRGLWVGGAGNVKVTTVGGSTVTFSGVAAGTMLPVRVARVWSTGTTATSMVGVY